MDAIYAKDRTFYVGFEGSFGGKHVTPRSLTSRYIGNMVRKHRGSESRRSSTGPLARPFARSLAPLTRSLAPHYSLRLRAPLRSLGRTLAHFAHSLARGQVNFLMIQKDLVLSHSAGLVGVAPGVGVVAVGGVAVPLPLPPEVELAPESG